MQNLGLSLGIKRVAILGAESSGKSTLAEALATHYQSVFVPEYLREFVHIKQRFPTEIEQIHIAKTQLLREDEALTHAKNYLFCDTTPIMTALYSAHYFQAVNQELEELVVAHNYQFTLVAAPDFPWVADGLQRDSAQVRQKIHEELVNTLDEREIPFLLLEGSLIKRIEQVQFAFSFLF